MPRSIAEDLGLASQNRTTISLADLQHSLGKALAALHWYGTSRSILSWFVCCSNTAYTLKKELMIIQIPTHRLVA